MTSTIIKFNEAQSLIYARTNIKRAYPSFDDSCISGIGIRDNDLIVMRENIEEIYDKNQVIEAFKTFTSRCPDFFSYLGPNYLGCSFWRDCSYIVYTGWHYSHQNSKHSIEAAAQRALHKHIKNNITYLYNRYQTNNEFAEFLENTSVFNETGEHITSIGHLIAPNGFKFAGETLQPENNNSETESNEPYCSCGSFQYQLKNLALFQKEIPGYKPVCKHLTWYQKHLDYYSKRTLLAEQIRAGKAPNKAVAWWYAPPANNQNGKFVMLYTKHSMGPSAPFKMWKAYEPDSHFTQHDVWDLFDRMIDNGYLPYAGVNLDHLKVYKHI